MAKCKECLYQPMCYKIEHFGRDLETDEACEHFRDAAKMVELPAKEGTTIYAFYDTSEYMFYHGKNKFTETNGKLRRNNRIIYCKKQMEDCTSVEIREIAYRKSYQSYLGKTMFLSRESAEKALREYAANGH